MRGATPPSKNGLSHANRERDPALAEALFWKMLAHLRSLCPALDGRAGRRWAGRFTRTIHIVDSTAIELIVSCLTGPGIAGARPRPSVICGWTGKVSCPASSCSPCRGESKAGQILQFVSGRKRVFSEIAGNGGSLIQVMGGEFCVCSRSNHSNSPARATLLPSGLARCLACGGLQAAVRTRSLQKDFHTDTKRICEAQPQTPYQRLLESPDIPEAAKVKLRAEHGALDPFCVEEKH